MTENRSIYLFTIDDLDFRIEAAVRRDRAWRRFELVGIWLWSTASAVAIGVSMAHQRFFEAGPAAGPLAAVIASMACLWFGDRWLFRILRLRLSWRMRLERLAYWLALAVVGAVLSVVLFGAAL